MPHHPASISISCLINQIIYIIPVCRLMWANAFLMMFIYACVSFKNISDLTKCCSLRILIQTLFIFSHLFCKQVLFTVAGHIRVHTELHRDFLPSRLFSCNSFSPSPLRHNSYHVFVSLPMGESKETILKPQGSCLRS